MEMLIGEQEEREMVKTRVPLQVSDRFALKLRELQRNIRKSTGNEKSLRDLTDDIANTELFEEIERKILKGNANVIDVKIKFDRRFL